MRVTKINYQKLFPLGMYINERLGLEAELEDGDSPEQSMQQLKKMTESMATNPNYGIVHELQPIPEINVELNGKDHRINFIASQIASCTEKVVLESYRLIAKQHEKLQAVYDK